MWRKIDDNKVYQYCFRVYRLLLQLQEFTLLNSDISALEFAKEEYWATTELIN